jgi:hypothetical protein
VRRVDAIAVHGLRMYADSKQAHASLHQATPLERRTMGHLQTRSQDSLRTRRAKLHNRGCNFPVGSLPVSFRVVAMLSVARKSWSSPATQRVFGE